MPPTCSDGVRYNRRYPHGTPLGYYTASDGPCRPERYVPIFSPAYVRLVLSSFCGVEFRPPNSVPHGRSLGHEGANDLAWDGGSYPGMRMKPPPIETAARCPRESGAAEEAGRG